jgi:hypothetical protein
MCRPFGPPSLGAGFGMVADHNISSLAKDMPRVPHPAYFCNQCSRSENEPV